MKTRITLFLTILLSSQTLDAKVQSCILDGGNDRGQRLCGSENYLTAVRSVYPTRTSSASYVEQAIVGDGDGSAEGSTEWDCQLRVYSGTDINTRVTIPHNTQITRANTGSSVMPATRANAQTCFQNATATDVCNFWSTNHGFYGDSDSSIFGRPQSSISTMGGSPYRVASVTATQMRASFDASSCGTTRYILNNCFSGGMHEMILDSSRNIIPNRCGVAASTYFQPAIKSTVYEEGTDPLDRTTPFQISGREGQFFQTRGTYNFTQSMTDALRSRKTYDGVQSRTDIPLDDAFFYTLKDDPTNELPTISSSYYLEEFFQGHIPNSQYNLADAAPLQGAFIAREELCQRSIFGENFYNSPIARLIEQISSITTAGTTTQTAFASTLTTTEKTAVRSDLTRLQNQLRLYETYMCSEFWASECSSLSPEAKRDFIQRKYQQDYVTRRDQLSTRYKDLVSRRQWDVAQQVANDLTTLERGSIYFRRYDFLINRLGQSMRFYQTAPVEKIRQYLGLRRCETTPFTGRATP